MAMAVAEKVATALTLVAAAITAATKLAMALTLVAAATAAAGKVVAALAMTAAKKVVATITKQLLVQTSSKLRQKRKEIQQIADQRLGAYADAADAADADSFSLERQLGPPPVEEADDENVTAADIFALLIAARDAEHSQDEDMNNDEEEYTLKRDDFRRLFLSLDLKLSDSDVARLFVMTDLNADGRVGQEEFIGGWDLLVNQLVMSHLDELGLSEVDIGLQMLICVALIALLLAFLIIALQGWLYTTSFGAIVQSTLISVVSKGVTMLRKRSAAEKENGIEQSVEKLFSTEVVGGD